MNPHLRMLGLLGFALLVCLQASAAEPGASPPPGPEAVAAEEAAAKEPPKQPEKKVPPKSEVDPFAAPTPTRGERSVGYNPQMLGDLAGVNALLRITVFGTQTTTTTITTFRLVETPRGVIKVPQTTTVSTTTPTFQTRFVLVPIAVGGAFKVAENESPMPQDRVFMNYNYFGALHGPALPSNVPITMTQLTGAGNIRTTSSVFIPATPPASANLHREVFGFEKTFLDGFASIELRVPIVQQSSNVDAAATRYAADLTIVAKYAFLLDRERGDVLSGGLAITAPSGPRIDTVDGPMHSTLLQPWMGYIYNFDRFYVQGFHSVVAPTDPRDVLLLFNDVGINFWLYRGNPDSRISSLVPTLEVHVTTPLNHRTLDSAIYVPDIVTFTGGVHIGIYRNSSLSLGVVTPVTGPRPFNVEAFAQFNFRF